ncbi:SusC/RagA family TonB-linked outer membrane protein [Prevotella sp. oral taxon 317]|uniref:SusC/RagA family TonB-linked outer membrane protein n=1 Tax=Prevotella sp. oral taxon 317 TaxID=652721 RepID=UPI0005C5CA81|nr:TonB-dependent receptor [Prevotella sp. oral taxon 317]
MSNFMEEEQMRRKHPPFVAGSVAFSLVLGLMAFGSPSVSAKADANTFASIQQQKQSITGMVTDANGDPIIGASVQAGGTALAVTGADGRFSVSVAPGTELQISYVGFATKAVMVRNGVSNYDVTLSDDSRALNEIVVVGYGTQKKANLSGSVAQLDGKTLGNRPIANVSSGLQGLLPGVTVTGASGAPGLDGGLILVRGVGTLNSASPYILIDGVEAGTLNSLDPQDIASISVLKDASSAAIYGSKASNGVILVTTKRGQNGAPKVNYSGFLGIQNATALMERMNSADAAYYYNKALERSGKAPRFTEEAIQKFRDGSDPYNYPNTDWYKLAFKTAWQNRHNVNVTGGNEFVKYLASAGYLKQSSILPNAGREQFNARANLDMVLSKRITAHLNLAYIQNNYRDASSAYAGGSSDQIIRQLNIIAPWIPYKKEDGSYGTVSDGNPMAWLESGMTVNRNNRNFTGMIGIDYQVFKDLKLTLQGAYVDASQRYSYFQKFIQYNANKATDPSKLEIGHYDWHRTTFDAFLNYDKSVAKHNFKAMLGWHTERYKYLPDWMYRKNFPNNNLTDMDAGDASTQKNSGYTRELTMVSYFGRLNYDYAGRYLFEANFRSDASSRFAKEHRWGFFPSFSAAWRISEEPFMERSKSWLDDLKLRASWGQLGNQDALSGKQDGTSDYYPWMNTYKLDGSYPFGGQLMQGYYQGDYHLSTISWERSTTWGVGVDFTLFGGLTGSIDYYNRKTTDIIMDVSAPAEFALGKYKDNIGALRNEGVEVSLAYAKQLNKDWAINAGVNFAYNKNKILNLGEGTEYIEKGDRRTALGQQYNSYYMYKATGKFFNSQEEADAFTAKYGNPFGRKFMAGDIIYEDTNGDGKLDSNDRVYTKHTDIPAITYNINLGATWKGFDLSMTWQGVGSVSHIFNREVLGEFSGDASHPSTMWKDSWTESNHNAKMPRVFETGNSPSDMTRAMSTFWLWNTAYLRLKTLQLGYSLPENVLKAIGVERVRIYYAGENLLTFHSLPFNIDPEITSERGSSYPLLRSHAIGINITF